MRNVMFVGEEACPLKSVDGDIIAIDLARLELMFSRIDLRRIALEIETGKDLTVRTEFHVNREMPVPDLIVKSEYAEWDDSEALYIDSTTRITIGELKAEQNAKTRH
jgi:hypothetical protein